MDHPTLYQRSIADRDGFWNEQADRIEWRRRFEQVCDDERAPFTRWFVGGLTNLCHNAVDRHLAQRADQLALVHVSTETHTERTLSYGQLFVEVQRMAAILQGLGVVKGDRVLIYMPMIPEAVIAMLATVRLGAIHSVVFGGFAGQALADRIDDAAPRVVVTADAGSRGGHLLAYKPLLDEALRIANKPVAHVLVVDRGLAPARLQAPQDVDYATARQDVMDAIVPCEWVESSHPSYILYTSGTTGKPKGVQRDTGGQAVALAMSMALIFDGQAGETFFCTSDISGVAGHSYTVYGPLLAGMTTLVHEGLAVRPDASIWWSLVERHRVHLMMSSPRAIRALRQHGAACIERHDLSSLKQLFLAGESLDEATSRWIGQAIGRPVVDQYWQTETGWPVLSVAERVHPGQRAKPGSCGLPMPGFRVLLLDEITGKVLTLPGQKGVLALAGPLPPGCLQTLWRDNAGFLRTYWRQLDGQSVYNTFDRGQCDVDGHHVVLGRIDDVIQVAGHRLGTREIEAALSGHPGVADVAVIGVVDADRGQVAHAFVVLCAVGGPGQQKDRVALAAELMRAVDHQLGPMARPASMRFVTTLPRTRSGKLLRRAIQAVCEGRETGDLSTMQDPGALQLLKAAVNAPPPLTQGTWSRLARGDS